MPTKTNKPSPFTLDPGTIMTIGQAVPGSIKAGKEAFDDPTLAGYKKKNIVTRGLAGWQTGNKALAEGIFGFDPASAISAAITGQEYEPGTHIGGQEYNKEPEQPKYTTNIDLMTGEEISPNQDLVNKGIPMAGKPIKALTQMHGTIAHNMSAAQYNKALQMKEISGASSLMFTEEGLNKLPNDIPGEFGDIVREEKAKQQKK